METAKLTRLRRLTIVGLGLVGLFALWIVAMKGAVIPAGLLFAGVPLLAAGLAATGRGWTIWFAALVAIIYLWESLQGAPTNVGLTAEPTQILPFMWLDAARVGQMLASILAADAALGASAERYRTAKPRI